MHALRYRRAGVSRLSRGLGSVQPRTEPPAAIHVLHEVLDRELPNLVQLDTPLLAGLLAEALAQRTPSGIDTVHFVNSGTEATEAAVKFSRCAIQKPRILSSHHGFHGVTYGALSATSNQLFRDGFGPLLPGCQTIPFNNLQAFEAELARGDVAAFIVEPIQGEGVNVPTDNFLPEAQRLCRKHGALLIMDEILTGLGRTGKFFAFEHWAIEPDIITIAKGLSGGLAPVGGRTDTPKYLPGGLQPSRAVSRLRIHI